VSRARPVLVLLGASVLWGASWLPLKALQGMGLGALPITAAAYGLLALLLAPLLVQQRRLWRGDGRHLLLIALLGGGANLAFTYAMVYGEVVRVMVLFYLLPVWGVLGGRFILGERVDAWRWLGVALALAGAFLILGGFRVLTASPSWLDLLALLSGLLFAMNNIVFRAAQRVPVGSKITAMFFGCSVLAVVLIASGVQAWPASPSSGAWLALVAYAVAWLLLANLGSQWGVTHLEAGRASIIIIMELITAVVSATLIGGETLSVVEMLGGLMILAAALIEALRTSDDDLVAHAGA
jgi:drug/metabolite transporter (DMT)-like permease